MQKICSAEIAINNLWVMKFRMLLHPFFKLLGRLLNLLINTKSYLPLVWDTFTDDTDLIISNQSWYFVDRFFHNTLQ